MAFFEERIDKGVIAKLQGIVDNEFARMDYTDAIGVLEKAKQKFEFPVQVGHGPAVRARALPHREATRRGPVIVMNYPKEIKAFYMRRNDDGKTVAAMDVLAPGIGEIIGGSQREERLDVLDARMDESGARPGGLRLVPRPAPLRHRAARRLRPRLRAHGRVRDGNGQHPRRDSVSAHAGERALLSCVDRGLLPKPDDPARENRQQRACTVPGRPAEDRRGSL